MRTVTVLATILATTSSILFTPQATAEPSLRWGACPDLGLPTPGLECTTLQVPLDYRDPGGVTISLAVSRLPSTDPARRRGVMLVNPGGPGAPGLSMPIGMVNAGLPASVRESFDLIGFDPRGIAFSSPVSCALPPQLQIGNVPTWARDAADVERRAVVVREIARQCGTGPSAAVLPYMNTANTARDMDRIRLALGERTISYYGWSYGAYLGAVYTTLFSTRTDRFVLDSLTGARGLDIDHSRRAGLGFQQRFPDFAAWAATRHDTYGLGRTPAQVTAKYFELADRLDRTPVNGIDGATLRGLTFGGLYFDATFPFIAELWQRLTVPAQPPVPDLEQRLSAQLALVCNDNDWPESVRTYQRNVAVDRVRFPMFGAAAANIWACAFWPSEPIEPPVRIDNRGPSNILLVQNLRDHATPLAGAMQLRAALGQRARMVTVDQGGHGVFQVNANVCGNDWVIRFFVDGRRPTRDSFCAKENTAPVGHQGSWLHPAPPMWNG